MSFYLAAALDLLCPLLQALVQQMRRKAHAARMWGFPKTKSCRPGSSL